MDIFTIVTCCLVGACVLLSVGMLIYGFFKSRSIRKKNLGKVKKEYEGYEKKTEPKDTKK